MCFRQQMACDYSFSLFYMFITCEELNAQSNVTRTNVKETPSFGVFFSFLVKEWLGRSLARGSERLHRSSLGFWWAPIAGRFYRLRVWSHPLQFDECWNREPSGMMIRSLWDGKEKKTRERKKIQFKNLFWIFNQVCLYSRRLDRQWQVGGRGVRWRPRIDGSPRQRPHLFVCFQETNRSI